MEIALWKPKPPDIEMLRQQNDVQRLISLLGDRDESIQWKASEALGSMGGTALKELNAVLRHPSRLVRLGGVEALGQIHEASAVPVLISILGSDPDAEVRWAASLALGEIGETAAIPALRKQLRDPDKYVRYGAAIALDWLGAVIEDPDDYTWYLVARQNWDRLKSDTGISTRVLVSATRDRDPRVRAAVIEVLGSVADPLACEAIEPALKDRDTTVLWNAVTSFRSCGVPALYIPMGLAKRPRFGKNPNVAAFLNLFFVGLGYNYLGMWWGFLLFQTNVTLLVLASLQVGPLIPYAVSISVSALFATHSWFLARRMPEI